MKQNSVKVIPTEDILKGDILNEDEHALLDQAVRDVQKLGFGEVTFTLCFRNGYIYRVKATIDSYKEKRANNEGVKP